MTGRETGHGFSPEITVQTQSAFATASPGAPREVISFLKLAERQGAYGKLSPKRREILEMRFAEGLSQVQIARRYGISKQAVSQSLKLSPESLYKQMTRDVITHRTPISFREILAAYSDYRIYLDGKKKGGE